MVEIIKIIVSGLLTITVSWFIFCTVYVRFVGWLIRIIFKFFDKFKLK